MIFVSIPVHEKIDVIFDSAKNIIKYLPGSCVVIHVSKNATFNKVDLVNYIKNSCLNNNVAINPISLDTKWGDIIRAHLCNIKFISSICNDKTAQVVFHSSNDMLVRQGASGFIENNKFVFHQRIYDRPGYWWPSCEALQDEVLLTTLSKISVARIVASQIEGSSYPLEVLLEISKRIEEEEILERSQRFYPKEEVYFPTFSYAMGYRPSGDPYVYSEVHRFDSMLWHKFKQIDSSKYNIIKNMGKYKSLINKYIFKHGKYKITIDDIKKIHANKPDEISIDDADTLWVPYKQPWNVFGVKRVDRNINDKIRQYINNL